MWLIPGLLAYLVGCAQTGGPAGGQLDSPASRASASTPVVAAPARPASREIAVPGTAIVLRFVPVTAAQGAFLYGATEVPWELYDTFVYGLDQPEYSNPDADAVSRPSKPYISMDRGFGRTGYPAISMSFKGAQALCEWLSAKTGEAIRLPTEAEWEHAFAHAGITAENLEDHAWFVENAGHTTHPIGARAADLLGLSDLCGNAAEWTVGADGTGVVRGGSYRCSRHELLVGARMPDSPAWNASDPQFPKSVWWLADGGFIGVRLVLDP